MLKFVQWLLKLGGGVLIAVPYIPADVIESARMFVSQADNMPAPSGEFKRAQVLRALMNRHPDTRESTCALAIELVLCGAV